MFCLVFVEARVANKPITALALAATPPGMRSNQGEGLQSIGCPFRAS
jgi:hypothetical protein